MEIFERVKTENQSLAGSPKLKMRFHTELLQDLVKIVTVDENRSKFRWLGPQILPTCLATEVPEDGNPKWNI